MRLSPAGRRAGPLLALAAGGLAAIAHPPFGFLPGLLGYAILMHLVEVAPGPRLIRAAFWRGWLAGFAYFFIGCWWVAEAFMVDARGQGWMAPFAACLLPAGLGLFWGCAMALYRVLQPKGPARVLAFAGFLTVLEWVRGHLLTGFPWNLPGETWAAGSALSQAASLVGAYGLTWLTLAIAGAFALPFGSEGRRSGLIGAGVAIVVLAGLWGFGAQRLSHAVAPDPAAPIVRVVQPDAKQEAKYTPGSARQIFERYLALTAAPAARSPDIVVWSEGAVPVSMNELLQRGGPGEAAILQAMRPGQSLVMGTYRFEGGEFDPRYFNSLVVVRDEAGRLRLTAVYDKYRLVPFGEYLPAEAVLAPLGFKDLTHIGDSYTHGPPPRPVYPEGAPAAQPLICYESLFPDLVRDAIRRGPQRPRWIVNVSNDSWFGVTSGPVQHLNQASYRAIEEGLPIVRATPTGVSGVIDAYGRILKLSRIDFGHAAFADARLPPAVNVTTYARVGDAALVAGLFLSLLSLAARIWSCLCSLTVELDRFRKAAGGRASGHG